MDTSQIFLLFLLLAFASAANILRNEEAVVCDPAEDPSSCPTNRRCEDEDGDGEYNCVCDKRFYTTHTLGHCVLGFKELVFDMEKELAALEMKQEHDVDWLNETLVDLLEIPTTTTTTTTTTTPGITISSGSILIVTGRKHPKNYDTVQLYTFNNDNTYGNIQFQNFPMELHGSTGQLVDDIPVLCGGENNGVLPKDCWKLDLTSGQWSQFATMAYSHFKTSSTVVDGKLLVIGGEEKGGNKLTATEYIDLDGEVTPGPDLPLPLRSHCAVTLTTGKVLIMGGVGDPDDNRYTTIMFDPETDTYNSSLPKFKNRFTNGGCTVIRSDYHDGRPVVLLVGGDERNKPEVYDYTTPDAEWEQAGTLPTVSFNWWGGTRVINSPDGKGAIIVNYEKVYELTVDTNGFTWTTLSQTLSQNVQYYTMFNLPEM